MGDRSESRFTRVPSHQRRLPTASEARDGGLLAYTNARALLKAADAAAAVKSYGASVGLGVLALEEAVKARMLLIRGNKESPGWAEVTDAGLRSILYGPGAHQIRHVLEGARVVFERYKASSTTKPPAAPIDQKQFFTPFVARTKLGDVKEAGFYVDFIDGAWTDPTAVTRRRWAKLRPLVAESVNTAKIEAMRARGRLNRTTD